jgi:penicillin amidase
MSRRLRRVAVWVGLGFLIAVLASTASAVIVYRHWSRRALPQLDGEVWLPGLTAPVTVRRDALGVPHVQGSSIPDVVRAQAYVTAQDRLWQMDLLRRRATGELAEAFGEGALRLDRDMRSLGLGAAAREALPRLSPEITGLLEAYAGGVNAAIDAHRDALPVEFRLLRYQPRPWTPADSLAVGKLLALDLAKGWESEAARSRLEERLPADVVALLYPSTFPEDRILFGSDGLAAARSRRAAGSGRDTSVGSNNWVVSGAHTATGRPLLANDPHLGLTVPSIWHVVHLTAPGLDVAGVALPGTPGVLIGRNDRVAWGCTNVEDDSADLYVEEFDPANPDRYRTPDGWETVSVREEPIRVRSGALASSWRTETHRARATRHGPLIEIEGRTYALRWTALHEASELTAFALLNRARNWDEFREALAQFPGPSQNFVYADVDGRIAWYSAGRLPVRRGGDGSVPYAGTSPDGDWLGFVAFEDLPHLVDPPSGRIVTANNRLVGTDYAHKVTRGGIGPWRAAAILEALETGKAWTTDDMVRLQSSRLSLPHRRLAQVLLEAAGRHAGDAVWDEIERELGGWDGRLEADSRAAALAVATFRAIGDRVIGPRLTGLPAGQALRLRRRTAAIERLLIDRPASWLPPADADWDAVLHGAWTDAVRELSRTLGGDRSAWTYGRTNTIAVRHPLTGTLPLGFVFNPPAVEMGGAGTTPNVLSVTPAGIVEAPSMRFVANLADPDDTRLVNFMGQSGHPASPHYDDQFDAWVRVESRRLPFTAEAVAKETRHLLHLVP